jgi:hypothetical protein
LTSSWLPALRWPVHCILWDTCEFCQWLSMLDGR